MTNQPSPTDSSSPVGRPGIFDTQSFLRRFIPFSSRFQGNTKSGMGYDLLAVFGVANTPTAFTIALGQIPSRYVQQGATVGGVVFASAGNQALWTANSITLQATVAGTYRIWVG
jgi:hypothetical protein